METSASESGTGWLTVALPCVCSRGQLLRAGGCGVRGHGVAVGALCCVLARFGGVSV